MASLAKENEEVFIPGNPRSVRIHKDSPALHILQRARDEAHRFAISYHHKLRRKAFVASALDSIAGIGPKRRRALLKRFGSVEAIRRAAPEEISQTEGITLPLARKVKKELAER
jgi:excinuclease ABC subunit C